MLTRTSAHAVAFAPEDNTPSDDLAEREDRAEAAVDPRRLAGQLKPFGAADWRRSLFELVVTLVPFFALAGLMLVAVEAGYLFALVLALPVGLFLLRLFLIQHDCGHGSFFRKRKTNDWVGRALGTLTFTPYDCWRRSHALHHAGTGNLDGRGFGDVDTLTVAEYDARSRWGRMGYRAYRHPLVLFGIGPAYLFLLRHRLPIGLMKAGWIYWASALATNLVTAAMLAALGFRFGFDVVALSLLPALLIAASIGVWLFYIQHQFEESHWDYSADWSFHDAALKGSSHLDLPPVLRWFTANIGIHHVHHLASRIPFYRLPDVLKAHPGLSDINRFSIRDTLPVVRLALWDEPTRRLVPFDHRARA
ncbi:fatty acid desaturase [Qipengyuania sp.]|uniref:fatty acid desaturase n=1 Tax=Qipengyuania sp. TaxID=2004515 RepID=UPI0035C79E5B